MKTVSGHLFLLKELIRRDFQGRYIGSVLGFFWSFAQPLWQLLLFTFVFSQVMRFELEGEQTESFGVFLFCGLLPWMAVQEGVLRGATAIVDNATVVKKAHLPLALLVLSPAVSALLHEGIAAAIFLVLLAATGELAWQGLPLLLAVLPLQLALTVGLGLLLCSLHTFLRDTAQIVGMLMMGWFYFTPIVYPLQQVPEQYRDLLAYNPLAPLVALYRQALLGGELRWVEGSGWLVGCTVVVLCAGLWLFRRLEKLFVDEV